MEEAKAAAYYEELTRKGEGAARFKQGLGFSTSSSSRFPSKSSSSSSSLLSSFVRASSPGKAADLEKQSQLHKIRNKLNPSREEERRSRDRDRYGERRRRRSRSASPEREDGGYRRGNDRERESRRRSRSRSPKRESRDRGSYNKREKGGGSQRSRVVDYSQLIEGYAQMTPAERVKAKMKLQLSQTAAKDTSMGMTTGWERFDFNKDAPLDGDDEIEVAEDDASLVKVIGKSFRSSAAEAKREEEVKAAHDQAMFGAPAGSPVLPDIESDQETDATDLGETSLGDVLISDKVIAMQHGSWRDRARRFQNSSGN